MNRRLALRRKDVPTKLRKIHVSVRISKESYIMLSNLVRKYPGLYASKSHCMECCLRRVYFMHKKKQIKLYME